MIGPALITDSLQKTLEKVAIVLGAGLVLGTAYLGINSIIQYAAGSSAVANTVTAKAEIKGFEDTLAKSKKLRNGWESKKGVEMVQTTLDRAATVRRCRLSEFQSSTDPAPFLTRYSKNGNANGWQQFAVQCQIDGPIGSIFEIMKEVTEGPIPIEIDSFDLSRRQILDNGDSLVSAKISLRVLRQEVPL